MSAFPEENAFYLTATPTRLAKLLAQERAFRRSLRVPGAIVECGVFKGASFSRLALLRQLYMNPDAKALIGFDTFSTYHAASGWRDKELAEAVTTAAGDQCITREALYQSLSERGIGENVELVEGDITIALPAYVRDHPELKVSFVNLDLDFYEGSLVALQELWPRLSQGGVMLLDDYGVFEGETRAVDCYFKGAARIRREPFAYSPCYVVKE